MMEDIKSLFNKKYHGSKSINGFYYQILYSVLISLELLKKKSSIITLEGIEDIDFDNTDSKLKTDSLYIQIKYRKEKLKWNEFEKTLNTFARTYKIDKTRGYKIVTNNAFASMINDFRKKTKKGIKKRKDFVNKHKDIEFISEEYNKLFNSIQYEIISIEDIKNTLKKNLVSELNCLEKTSILIMKKLISDFFEIASRRGTVDYNLLNKICYNIQEVIASEEYNAFGRGLIERINWKKIGNKDFFYQGKSTQPEHINQNLDIKREKWLNLISDSFNKNNTTIIKASSGQGKSTLLYRYAKDYGIEETTFIIRKLADETDIVNIERYLITISKIGLKVLVLIDNLNNETRKWAELISRCQNKNINFLISVREEEWFYYSKNSVINFEIFTPFLNFKEADEIFRNLKKRKLINDSTLTSAKAFELLDEPKLLIEFIFLCTQGKMLEDKLKDQLGELSKFYNSLSKKKLLKFINLASILGIELTFEQVRNLIDSSEDILDIIESLKNEYIVVNKRTVTGFHHIRSKHIVKLLHTKYFTILNTSKELFQYLKNTQIPTFFSNLFFEFRIDYDTFLDVFKDIINKFSLEKINELIKVIHRAGIYNYVLNNKQMIDEAYELFGFSALFILSYELMPKLKEQGFKSIFESSPNKGYGPKLIEISKKENKTDSGIEYVKKFINLYNPKNLLQDYKNIGVFLEWCNYVNCNIIDWDNIKKKMIFKINYDDIDFESLCNFTLGLYRYDATVYHQFIRINKDELLDYLKLRLECYLIELTSDEITIYFIPILSEYNDLFDQAKPRLDQIRMLFPYLNKYNSKPKEELYFGLKPSKTNNVLMMDPKYLLPSIDSIRSNYFLSILQMKKIPKSSYEIQEFWFNLRDKSLFIMKNYSEFILRQFKGLKSTIKRDIFDNYWLEILYLLNHVKYIDNLRNNIYSLHKNIEKILCSKILNDWAFSLHNFFRLYTEFINKNGKSIELCMQGLKDAINKFAKFHKFFEDYFKDVQDYFNQNLLKNEELKYYNNFYDLLELRYIENVKPRVNDPIQYIQKIREKKRKNKIKTVKNLLSDIIIKVADNCLLENNLTYIPIVYECKNIIEPFNEIIDIIEKLLTLEHEMFHFYWLIPIFNGNRFNEIGCLISSYTINQKKINKRDFQWENFIPQEIPETIIDLIPEYKTIIENKEYNDFANLEAIKVCEKAYEDLKYFVTSLPDEKKFEKLLKKKYFKKINVIKDSILND